MIQVRNGIFETNSSSVHAISVYTVPPKDLPKKIHLTLGEYGWGHGLYSLPNYIFTACAEMKRIDDLIGMLDTIGVECTMDPTPDVIAKSIKKRGYLPYDLGYIDHCGCLSDFIDAILCDEHLFKCAMFNPESQVELGNDNVYEDEEEIPRPIEGEHWYSFRKWN